MSNIVKGLGRTYARSSIIMIVSVLIVVPLFCVCIFIPLFMVTGGEQSIWILIVSSALFLMILFGGGGGFMAWTLLSRKRNLDAAFASYEMEGSAYNIWFRKYLGQIEDREAGVYMYRGPVLEIEVSTSLQTRLGITGPQADSVALGRLLGQQPMELHGLAPEGLHVYPLDEEWTRALLAEPGVADLLRRLTTPESFFVYQHVVLRPGKMKLHFAGSKELFRFKLDPEEVQRWVDDLLQLVQIAESIPAPTITAEETSVEEFAGSLRKSNVTMIATVVLVVGMLLCFCVIFVGAMLFAMNS